MLPLQKVEEAKNSSVTMRYGASNVGFKEVRWLTLKTNAKEVANMLTLKLC